MAASGEIQWPPTGRFPWPPSHGPETTLYVIDLASKPASFTRSVRPRVALVKAAPLDWASRVAPFVRLRQPKSGFRTSEWWPLRAAGSCPPARLSTRLRCSQLPPTRLALAALVPEHLVASRRTEQTAFALSA